MTLRNYKYQIGINNFMRFQNPISNGSRFIGRAISGLRLAPDFFWNRLTK